MKNVIRSVTLAIHFISLASMLILGAVGVVYEALNLPYFVKLLAYINITWNLGYYWAMFLATFVVFAGTFLLLKKST